jgi:hypothetical protein
MRYDHVDLRPTVGEGRIPEVRSATTSLRDTILYVPAKMEAEPWKSKGWEKGMEKGFKQKGPTVARTTEVPCTNSEEL